MSKLEREVLVCYDIASNRSRTRLHDALEGLGLIAIQESVFWGFLRDAEVREATRLIAEHATRGDRGFLVPVAMQQAEHAGYAPPAFQPPPRSTVV